MLDRQTTNPGHVKLTLDDGTVFSGFLRRDDGPIVEGTPLNKANLFDDLASERYAAETPNEAFNLIGREIVVTVPADGWYQEDGWYKNQVAVPEMRAVHQPRASVYITSADTAVDESLAFGVLYDIETFDGYIVCKALEPAAIDFSLRLTGV